MKKHTVAQGDTLTKISRRYNVPVQKIWEHPGNGELREKRRHPDVLYPGDTVTIPDPQRKTVTRPSDQRHVFHLKRPAANLHLRIMLNGEPCSGAVCCLDAAGPQTADDQGLVTFPIEADLERSKLTIQVPPGLPSDRSDGADDNRTHAVDVMIGHLDPEDEITGIQARLCGVGFHADPIAGDLNQRTHNAVARFQKAFEILETPTGEIDGKTKAELVRVYEKDQRWKRTFTDEDKICRSEKPPVCPVSPTLWNLINLLNGPQIIIDSHMHIQSGRCCPVPLFWDKTPYANRLWPDPTDREKIENGIDWALTKLDMSLKKTRSVLARPVALLNQLGGKSIDTSEKIASRLIVIVAEALITLNYVQTGLVQAGNTAAANGAAALVDGVGEKLDQGAGFLHGLSAIYDRLAQTLRQIGQGEAEACVDVLDRTTGVATRIVEEVLKVHKHAADAAAGYAADMADRKAQRAKLIAMVEAELAQVCYAIAVDMNAIADEMNRAMDLAYTHAAGLVSYVANEIANVVHFQAEANRAVLAALQTLPAKADRIVQSAIDDAATLHAFTDKSAQKTVDIGKQAVAENRATYAQLPVAPYNDRLSMMMVMPMDMDFGHLDGYEGKQIYDKVLHRHTWHYALDPWFAAANATGGGMPPMPAVLPPGTDVSTPEYQDGTITEEKGPFYYYYRRVGNADKERKKLIWMSKSEYDLFEDYPRQIMQTIAVSTENPWELIPLYHYDPRRWSEQSGVDPGTEAFDNKIWDIFPRAWDEPFTKYFNESSSRQFIGFKLYTALGYKPLDPKLPNQQHFYAKCIEGDLPIVCHATPAGMYAYDRLRYAAYNAKTQGIALSELEKQTKRLMAERGVKADWREYYFCEHYISPRAWKKVLDSPGCQNLRLCLAHFGGDEEQYTTWNGDDKEDRWDQEMVRMALAYPNFYIDISYFFVNKYFDKFAKAIKTHKHLKDKILFGTDWWLIGSSIYTYESYCLETKAKLDQIDPELWPRFSWINPMRFYRIKENKDAICNGLKSAVKIFKNDKIVEEVKGKILKGFRIIENLEN
ncbi:MAG: hypothetical protein VR64_11135 [Desulfatitalea sp. BRH_c12]|nr:MAG: hypothetical protein VR64_11135 [Desulfatitalea sp. BRH_c12]